MSISRSSYDEMSSFATWWAISSLVLLLIYARVYEDFLHIPSHDFVLKSMWWSVAMTIVIAIPTVIALSRQGRMGRHVARALGIIAPMIMLYTLDKLVPGMWVDRHQFSTLFIGVIVLAIITWLVGIFGKRALKSPLTNALSLAEWGAVHKGKEAGVLILARNVLGLSCLKGFNRVGRIAKNEAAIFSGACTVTSVPHLVDRRARFGMFMAIMLSKGNDNKPEDMAETVDIFLTVIAVALTEKSQFTSFDLRSRSRGDADVVFDNAADWVHEFESVLLGENYEVRFPQTTAQLHVWKSFSPVVVDKLASCSRINIRKEGEYLLLTRFGGCGTPQEIDELYEIASWLVAHMQDFK